MVNANCIDELINIIQEKKLSLNNRQLVRICRQYADCFSMQINPHLYGFAEKAGNLDNYNLESREGRAALNVVFTRILNGEEIIGLENPK